jgi:hypothetical protein
VDTLAKGAKQFVVQEAFDKILISSVSSLWFTPITNIGVSSLEGAERITFLAPALMCFAALSLSKNKPVDSTI